MSLADVIKIIAIKIFKWTKIRILQVKQKQPFHIQQPLLKDEMELVKK